MNFIENQPFLASLWSAAKTVTYAGFGDGRVPITFMALAVVIGLILGLRYSEHSLVSSRIACG